MSGINNGGPAFPEIRKVWTADGSSWHEESSPGMTLRDYFAGQANSAWIQALSMRWNEPGYSDEAAAVEASRLAEISADAMIAEREKR